MFLQESDLGSTIYNYQIEQITDGDDGIVAQAMSAAEEELRSYLTTPEWSDGRTKYDVDAILSATEDNRNALLVRQASTLAKWYIVELCNADIIYETAKERYDRAIDWLKELASENVKLSTLPTTPAVIDNSDYDPFIYGSREKFNHE